MKKISLLALASLFVVAKSLAISLDDIPLWTGSGTNRAALVIEWNSPEVFEGSSVAAPLASKTMVWGYRFNGTPSAVQMFNAIMAANPRLYAVETIYPGYGASVDAIGYSLTGSGPAGVTDGTVTDPATNFSGGVLIDPNLNVDGTQPLNSGDLFWSGFYGPDWQLWTELGDQGGFTNCPARGSSPFYDSTTGNHGQWSMSDYGLAGETITNGSWLGFSVAAAPYPSDPTDPAYLPYNNDEQAPPTPDGTYVAFVANTNDFATRIISTNDLDAHSPYNNPTAVLGPPALEFYDPFDGDVTDRVSVIDPAYNVTPAGSNILAVIENGGEITVQLGRKVYNNPAHPYGVDFIIYGNTAFDGLPAGTGTVSDNTDLSTVAFTSSGSFGHTAVISVSQDNTNWYTYATASEIFPDNAYRWDDTNDSWTEEAANPNKPLNPAVYSENLTGLTVAGLLDQFNGAAGGTGYSLQPSGLPWIQYLRIQPQSGVDTVIDAIAAVNPVIVGDALSITPANVTAGVTNLVFQNPADTTQNLLTLGFASISDLARVSTASLGDLSSYAPVIGTVSGAYKTMVQPVTDASPVTYLADVNISAGAGYTGGSGNLRVYQWNCTNWTSLPFTYDPTNNQVAVTGLTNFSALVVSQIIPPTLTIQNLPNAFAFQFTPVPNAAHTLTRSTDLATWTPVATVTPLNSQPVTLQDNNPPAGKAFYRLSVNVP